MNPKPSSTILLVRDNPYGGNIEVLLMQRRHSITFGGAYTFPGGKTEKADCAPNLINISNGPSDPIASRTLKLSQGGLSYFIASIRECFEETGIFLAVKNYENSYKFVDHRDIATLSAYRSKLNDGKISLETICVEQNIILATNRLIYVSHWITPQSEKKRYSTRFFLAPMPSGQIALPDGLEAVRTLWIEPERALQKHECGELKMFIPTIVNLKQISGFTSIQQLLDNKAEADSSRIFAIEPKLVFNDGKWTAILPDQPGYDASE